MRRNFMSATMRRVFDSEGRSARTRNQYGGKENWKTAHEQDRGGYQELSQNTEPGCMQEVLILVPTGYSISGCGDFHRTERSGGVKIAPSSLSTE